MNKETESVKERAKTQFDKWSSNYEEPGFWNWYFNRSYSEASNYLLHDDINILDLGTGTGGLCRALSRINPDLSIVGMDISEQMIAVAKSMINSYSNISYVVGDADYLPFNDRYFDVVYCLNSFHHYPNPAHTLSEISRCLRRGGRIILLDPYTDGALRKVWTKILKKIFNEPDVTYYSKNELKYLLTKAGFDINTQTTFLGVTLITEGKKL